MKSKESEISSDSPFLKYIEDYAAEKMAKTFTEKKIGHKPKKKKKDMSRLIRNL